MKETEKLENAKPQTRPVVYFKDFEKRFDDLLTKNKTPRAETISTISPRQRGGDTARTTKSQSNPEEAKNVTQKGDSKKKKGKEKKDRPPTPVFFENFAPPKKAKKGGLNKKRYASNANKEKPVNLLVSILHSQDKLTVKKKSTTIGKKK